ncbi:uncharacterized protein LOC143019961 [Oratosquilla oratoria]|uniref:uncharacterized protein LOC143019961 n=1 Tax=Oratosquilla oratoria TaxID=337810 RepID=UPI003F7649C4
MCSSSRPHSEGDRRPQVWVRALETMPPVHILPKRSRLKAPHSTLRYLHRHTFRVPDHPIHQTSHVIRHTCDDTNEATPHDVIAGFAILTLWETVRRTKRSKRI